VPGLAHSTMPEAWRDLQQRCSAVEEMLKRGELEERLGGKPWEIHGKFMGISEYPGNIMGGSIHEATRKWMDV